MKRTVELRDGYQAKEGDMIQCLRAEYKIKKIYQEEKWVEIHNDYLKETFKVPFDNIKRSFWKFGNTKMLNEFLHPKC